MAAKKDPYKRIQKRFVQARAGDVEYEDLSPQQREQFQNRFNMLAQSVEGRGKIARRILGPEAAQEDIRGLRQRIRQNLPSSGRTTTTTGGGTTFGGTAGGDQQFTAQRLAPTSADIRNMRAGFRSQGAAIETRRQTKSDKSTTTATPKGSDRWGSGFWSVPKSPITAIKEMGRGIKDIADYQTRAYVNPVINVAAAAADIVGGRKGSQKFKPLPTLSNKEIAIESAIIATTAGAGKLISPLVRPTGSALAGIAKSLTRRGAVGTGAALSNIAQRQAASAAVRSSAALQAQGRSAILRDAATYGDDAITRGLRPGPSGVTRTPPKSSGMVKSPTAATTTTPKPTRTSAKKAPTKKASTKSSTKPTTSGTPTGRSTKPTGQTSKPKSSPRIAQVSLSSTSTPQATKPAAQQTAKPIVDIKDLEATFGPVKFAEPETVGPVTVSKKSSGKVKPSSVKPLPTSQPTRAQIESATEAYTRKSPNRQTPGVKRSKGQSFNREIGEIEMRSTQYEPIDLKAKFSSPVEEVKTSKPTRVSRKATQKKSQETVNPVSNPPVAQAGQKAVVVKSRAEILWESMRTSAEQARAAQKAAFPGFTPKKVTKLPKQEPGNDRGSMLFRMFDQGVGSPKKQLPTEYYPSQPTSFLKPGELSKEIEEQLVLPNVKIKKGEAINPRYTRGTEKTAGQAGQSVDLPEDLSKGKSRYEPTRMPPSREVGLSSEQRRAKFYREEFPQARSAREARKMWEESRGVPLEQREFTTGYQGGSPQGAAAKKSPVTSVEIKKPVKYEKGRNAKGEVVYKPVAFKTESVPGIETTSGPVPIEELPQRWKVSPAVIEKARKTRKAETLKSRAKQAAQLRNRGIAGEARGATLQQSLEEIKKGKAFQRRFDNLKDKK